MKLRVQRYFLTAIATAMLIVSCQRQELEDPQLYVAHIPITMDWSSSMVDESAINNTTIYFYPISGAEPIITYSSDSQVAIVSASQGVYNILIHNEATGNITGVDCNDCSCYYDYSMSIEQGDSSQYTMFYTPKTEEQLIEECEPIASWSYENFSVTEEMIAYTRSNSFDDIIAKLKSNVISSDDYNAFCYAAVSSSNESRDQSKSDDSSLASLTNVSMMPLSAQYKVTVEISNMNNIQYIEGVIPGFVDKVVVSSGDVSSQTDYNYTYFNMTDYTYNEGSTTDGYLTYQFTNLGHITDLSTQCAITINIILHNGELRTEVVDITDQIVTDDKGAVIEINIGDSFGNGTSTIVLPESSGTGFGVSGWGNAENIPL